MILCRLAAAAIALECLQCPAATAGDELMAPAGRSAPLGRAGWELFLPDGLHPAADGTYDLLVHFHGASPRVRSCAAAAGLNAAVATVNYNGLSGVYSQPFADPALFPELLDAAEGALRASLPAARDARIGRVAVSSFSAGYGAVRQLLGRPVDADRIDTLVLGDSLYASTAPDGAPQSDQIDPFEEFARRAMAGEKTFVFSYSLVPTSGYETTRECGEEILRRLGLRTHRVSITEGPLRWTDHVRRGGFVYWGAAGDTGDDHMNHLRRLDTLLAQTLLSDRQRPVLIAHRGGAVESGRAENSAAAVREAIERGYAGVEVDVRETADGVPIAQHDEDFRRDFHDPRLVANLTWDEVSRLRSEPDGEPPLSASEFARLCRGKLSLMLDTKEPSHPAPFYEALFAALEENGLVDGLLVIGTEESRREALARGPGRARASIDAEGLAAAIARGEDVARRYFLFGHASDLDAETVADAQQRGVLVVASVNEFHYGDEGDRSTDPRAAADLARLRRFGVTHLQIDAAYEPFCR